MIACANCRNAKQVLVTSKWQYLSCRDESEVTPGHKCGMYAEREVIKHDKKVKHSDSNQLDLGSWGGDDAEKSAEYREYSELGD